VANDLEAGGLGTQRSLHLVGEARLVPRFAGDVDQRRGQFDGVPAQVQHGSSVVAGTGSAYPAVVRSSTTYARVAGRSMKFSSSRAISSPPRLDIHASNSSRSAKTSSVMQSKPISSPSMLKASPRWR